MSVLALAAVAIAAGIWYFAFRTPPIPHRILRIGYEQVPPVQIKGDNGPTGLAIETVAEAAKRAGISTAVGGDRNEFRGGVPPRSGGPLADHGRHADRRNLVHITKPWLHTSHTLVLREGTPTPNAGFTGRIAVVKMPLHVRLIAPGVSRSRN